MPYKDPEKQAEYMRKYRTPYMREYYEKQRETATSLVEQLKKHVDLETLDLLEPFVREQMDKGFTREQAEEHFKNVTMPPGDAQTINDMVSEPKLDAYELIERSKKLIEMYQEMRATRRATDSSKKPNRETRQEMEQTKVAVDIVAKAREELKEIPDRGNAEKIRLLKIEDEQEKKYGHYPKLKKKTRADEYGKPIPLYSHTVPNLYEPKRIYKSCVKKEEEEETEEK